MSKLKLLVQKRGLKLHLENKIKSGAAFLSHNLRRRSQVSKLEVQ